MNAEIFDGRKMTYYGRWTYKYEEGARQGAQAVFIVHDKLGAGYDWTVVQQVITIHILYKNSPSGIGEEWPTLSPHAYTLPLRNRRMVDNRYSSYNIQASR